MTEQYQTKARNNETDLVGKSEAESDNSSTEIYYHAIGSPLRAGDFVYWKGMRVTPDLRSEDYGDKNE